MKRFFVGFCANLMPQFYRHLYPYTCILCNKASDQAKDLCLACQMDLPWLRHCCQLCGLALPTESMTMTCGHCLQNPPPYDYLFSLWQYQAPLTRLITGIKFHQRLAYSRLLTMLFSEYVQQHYQQRTLPECIIPIPLHAKRLRQRGFNQALLLAKPCAKALNIPLNTTACLRNRATLAQSSIPAKQRLSNLKRAFSVNDNFSAQHVAIVDDVITTGQTVDALSRALKQTGVKQIDVWCCARTQWRF